MLCLLNGFPLALLRYASAHVQRHRGFGARTRRLADNDALGRLTAGVLDDDVAHLVVAQHGEGALAVPADEVGSWPGRIGAIALP